MRGVRRAHAARRVQDGHILGLFSVSHLSRNPRSDQRGDGAERALEEHPVPELKAPIKLGQILDAYETFGHAAHTLAAKLIVEATKVEQQGCAG